MPERFFYDGTVDISGSGSKVGWWLDQHRIAKDSPLKTRVVYSTDQRNNSAVDIIVAGKLIERIFVVDGVFGVDDPPEMMTLRSDSEARLPTILGFVLPPGPGKFALPVSPPEKLLVGSGCEDIRPCATYWVPLDLGGNDYLGRWNSQANELTISNSGRETMKWTFTGETAGMPNAIQFEATGFGPGDRVQARYQLTKRTSDARPISKSDFITAETKAMIFRGDTGFVAPPDVLTTNLEKFFDRQVVMHKQVAQQREGGVTWWIPFALSLFILAGAYFALRRLRGNAS